MIEVGKAVSLRHYSGFKPFKSIVLKNGEDNITLKLIKGFTVTNFFEGDPVAVCCQINNEACALSGCICNINARGSYIEISIGNIEALSDKIIFERFPVSLYMDIKQKSTSKRVPATVKSLSLNGMCMRSKHDFQVGQEIEYDIFFNEKILTLKAEVTWKSNSMQAFEYGLKTIYSDFSTKNFIKLFLQMQADEERKIAMELND